MVVCFPISNNQQNVFLAGNNFAQMALNEHWPTMTSIKPVYAVGLPCIDISRDCPDQVWIRTLQGSLGILYWSIGRVHAASTSA